MEQQVFFLLFVLGMLSAVQGSTTDHCNDGVSCPGFHVAHDYYGGFEKREYNCTRWITTKALSSTISHLMAAHQKLKDYCEGASFTLNTWPALLTVAENEDGSEKDVSLSWFVGAGTGSLPNSTSSIIDEVRPAATVYVKVFNSKVSREEGLEARAMMLGVLGNTAKPHVYSAATYNSLLAVDQHNEVWVYAA